MGIYLRAKHWQLFLVLVGSMFLTQALMLNSVMDGGAVNPLVMILPTVLIGAVFFGWIWAIASACYRALPRDLASSPRPMQIGLVYALIYISLSGILLFGSGNQLPGYVALMHLLAMAAIFYSLGYTAKQLTKLEQKQDVTFFSYSGPFFLLWFFPLGIWFIQPKVNQLLGQEK